MTRVDRYVTRDGVEHQSVAEATRHLDQVFKEALKPLQTAHSFAFAGGTEACGWGKMQEFIEKNLPQLEELIAVNKDYDVVDSHDM